MMAERLGSWSESPQWTTMSAEAAAEVIREVLE